MKVRLKHEPVLEAERFMGGFSYDEMCVEWGENFAQTSIYYPKSNQMFLINSKQMLNIGDYVIKGITEEFFKCEEHEFEKFYQPIE